VESSDDAIVSKDLNGIVRSWNRSAERMFGYTADEIVGHSILTIIPEDRRQEEDRVLAAIRAGERVDHFETVRRTKSGSLIPVSLTVSPIRDATGTVVGASKIARDISDRKRADALAEKASRRDAFLAQITLTLGRSLDAEQTLKDLAQALVPYVADYCAIDVVNEDHRLERLAVAAPDEAKAAFAQHVPHDPASEVSPLRVLLSGAPVFVPEITDDVLVDAASGDEHRLAMLRSLHLVSFLRVPMKAHSGGLGVLTLANAAPRSPLAPDELRLAEDIAARAAMAMENARSFQAAQDANRLKDEFLATLSHELRTPLNAVLGYTRMVRSGAVPPDRLPNAFEVMERNAGALARIVEDVLDVSRIISGKARIELQQTDLGKVLEDGIATVAPSAEARGIVVERAFDAPGFISGDPNRLRQVFWNLLSNAVKFTPEGGRVSLTVRRLDRQVEIEVRDTGIGFAPEFRPFLFERFRQAEGGPTRPHGGLGLGLSIVRHIVEMHGGTIDADSAGAGKGAAFVVRLPASAVPAASEGVIKRPA
jgi:PAS domain S-box-containing protein